MYILTTLGLLFSFEDFGFPHVILLPLLFLGVGVAQFFLFKKFRFGWILSPSLLAVALIFEVLIFLTRSWAAIIYVVCLTYVMSCLLGALVGLVVFFVSRFIKAKKCAKTE